MHTAYAETLEDTPHQARERERAAIERAIGMLQHAQANGRRSREAVEAPQYLRRLWSVLMEDLASPENDLPEKLRADLISIGLWVVRETELIRQEKSDDFPGLIEVMKSIADGLR